MRFIDLFAGVGGFRLGMERAGHECVWSCEIDRHCREVYKYHWEEVEAGDARLVDPATIPDFDLLCAGFPCPSFSIAGKRKGFEDPRGKLFHEICRIARVKRPQMLLLENVEGLLSADDWHAFGDVLESLGNLGYDVEWQVLNSKDFGVPQNRSRVFIVGHLGGFRGRQIFPLGEGCGISQQSREKRIQTENSGTLGVSDYKRCHTQTYVAEEKPMILKKHMSELRVYADGVTPAIRQQMGAGGGNVPMVVDTKKVGNPRFYDMAPTLQSNDYKEPLKVAIPCLTPDRAKKRQHGRRFKNAGEPMFTLTGQDTHGVAINTRIRRLTPRECERLQGFPDDWTRWGLGEDGRKIEISDTQRYRMMGNAVTVNVIEVLARRFNGG